MGSRSASTRNRGLRSSWHLQTSLGPAVVAAVSFVVVIALLKLVAHLLDAQGVIRAETPGSVIALGAIIGLTYGLLAVGVVLVYRANRIINFAHGQIGAFGAAVFGLAAVKWHLPYWIAFVFAIAVAAATSALAEAGVVRRLRNAPRLMSIVATLGVAQFLLVLGGVINSDAAAGQLYPQPVGLPEFEIGPLLVTPAYSGMLFLSPVVVLCVVLFLQKSRFGIAMRAAAANADSARMSGIVAARMSTLAWAIAGALSGFIAILTAPTQGFISGETFGPGLLLRALAAAVIGRMTSLPLALAGGIGIGVLEQLYLWNYPSTGYIDLALFGFILVALLLQRAEHGRGRESGSWSTVQAFKPLPPAVRRLPAVRALGPAVALGSLTLLALLPIFVSNSRSVAFAGILAFAIVGMSIVLSTGLGGQLTLGQFGIAAVGGVTSIIVLDETGSFTLGLVAAALLAGATSVVLGVPALRLPSLMYTVATLGFALATPSLLAQDWALGLGKRPGKPEIWFVGPLETGRDYFYFALAMFAVVLVVAYGVKRSDFGRLMVAVRDNEDNARAFSVRITWVKLHGHFLAGAIAGVGGVTLAHSFAYVSAISFPAGASIEVVTMTVLGGVSTLAGPLLGAAWVLGLPMLNIGNLGLAATNLGILLVILWKPGGLVEIAAWLRDRTVRVLTRGMKVAEGHPAERHTFDRDGEQDRLRGLQRNPKHPSGEPAVAPGTPLLEANGLSKSFGGVHAVRGVSFTINAGETVGLIGPNGAGKTTTFELLSGFTRLDRGTVAFAGADITRTGPAVRARHGLIRSFQDAALFPTMTVQECVMVAFERVQPTSVLASFCGLSVGARKRRQRSEELLDLMGLGDYRDHQIQTLSTGTRRITEIACLVALEPICLLLDEPSSGVAQKETEALGRLLVDLKRRLGLTMVIIEHDLPLVMGISDRIIAMADGEIIAEGLPSEVRENPRVTEAYLGGSIEAIERSDFAMEHVR